MIYIKKEYKKISSLDASTDYAWSANSRFIYFVNAGQTWRYDTETGREDTLMQPLSGRFVSLANRNILNIELNEMENYFYIINTQGKPVGGSSLPYLPYQGSVNSHILFSMDRSFFALANHHNIHLYTIENNKVIAQATPILEGINTTFNNLALMNDGFLLYDKEQGFIFHSLNMTTPYTVPNTRHIPYEHITVINHQIDLGLH